MKRDLNLKVEHITRLEGHGDIVVDVQDGVLKEARLDIVEAPRFFESMLRGRRYDEAAVIGARICGICSVSHTCASLKATEKALGIMLSDRDVLLRKLSYNGEMVQSHVLHVMLLVAPDLLGVNSVFPLIETHKDAVLMAMRMKKLANDTCQVVGGGHVHGCAMVPGGLTHIPTTEELLGLKGRYEAAIEDVKATVELLSTLTIPEFDRETEYISLKLPDEYALYDGQIYSSDGGYMPVESYRQVANEYIVPHAAAKRARWHRDAYMVGALARVNNSYDQLLPLGKQAAEALGLTVPCHNPFMINVAQVVETAHCVEDSIRLIDQILETGLPEEVGAITPRAGSGVGAVEAPRGILFHDYEYDGNGAIVSANCIIPTAQNTGNIELDMKAIVPQLLDLPEDEISLTLQILVRAYDPCISCATHLLDVKFV